MGGAIAAAYCHLEDTYKLSGLILFDIVEGSAINSLSSMNLVIQRRPKRFESIEDAVQWRYLLSVPVEDVVVWIQIWSKILKVPVYPCLIKSFSRMTRMCGKSIWRRRSLIGKVFSFVSLYFVGWYKGMDNLFLTAPGYKLLALAKRDTLDTPMIIAHMQGIYRLEAFQWCTD